MLAIAIAFAVAIGVLVGLLIATKPTTHTTRTTHQVRSTTSRAYMGSTTTKLPPPHVGKPTRGDAQDWAVSDFD